jgi:hypothetical protein
MLTIKFQSKAKETNPEVPSRENFDEKRKSLSPVFLSRIWAPKNFELV